MTKPRPKPSPSAATSGARSTASVAKRQAEGYRRLPPIMLTPAGAAALAQLTRDGATMREVVERALIDASLVSATAATRPNGPTNGS